MTHVRQQVRAAFITAITGLATTGTNVYNHRAYAITGANLPALMVRNREDAEQETDLGDTVISIRRLQITVDILVRAATGAIDDLDAISVEVEEAIGADETLGGLADWCRVETFDVDVSDEAESTTMQGSLTFIAIYRVNNADVETTVS